MLFKKMGQGYLEQLFKYITDKKKRNIIQSEKKYLFGVIKNAPPIEDLLTPFCVQKLNQDKLNEHNLQEVEKNKRYSLRRKEEEEGIANRVEAYCAKLTAGQVAELEEEFSLSMYGRGLKF